MPARRSRSIATTQRYAICCTARKRASSSLPYSVMRPLDATRLRVAETSQVRRPCVGQARRGALQRRKAMATPKPRKRKPPQDVAILHGPTEDGEGARVLRLKQGTLYAGEVRPVREGQSIEQHELVRLKPLREDSPVCEV